MPITTIVCRHCSKVLRKGDPGGIGEFKICPQCVIKTHKHSPTIGGVPKEHLLKSTTEGGRTRFSVENELNQLKKRMSKLNIEIPYIKTGKEYHAVIQIKDSMNKPFAEFGFPASKLREMANDLDRLKEQEV